MSLKDDLLPVIDSLRAIPGELGFRPYQVWVRITTYSGARVGLGVATTTETRLLVGGRDPKVREVRSKDIVAGIFEAVEAEYDIGPLTPEFLGGGIDYDTVNPDAACTPTTVVFVLKGPGMPADGLLCKRVKDDIDRPLRMTVRVRSMGRKRPT